MDYILIMLFSMFGGYAVAWFALAAQRAKLRIQWKEQVEMAERIRQSSHTIGVLRQQVDSDSAQLASAREEFDKRSISYRELADENAILKRDLRNLDISARKLQLDRDQQRQAQHALDARSNELASRYLKENVKWVSSSLTANNFTNCKQRLVDVVQRCRAVGFDVPDASEVELLANLKAEFTLAVRAEIEREEQARIKAQMREELLRQKEIDRELKQIDREKEAIRAALDKALAEAKDQYSAVVEGLKARLADAEERSRRAISQAQLTKSGHVYVISNIGSFGDGVYKIGMTRRLEPKERVSELSGAAVPFPFDVHMMISSDDAPSLEAALHRQLRRNRVNKTNPRKEFFRTDIKEICDVVKQHHNGEVSYIADAEALQYRQSLTMPDDDQEFIENTYDTADEEDGEPVAADI